MEMTSLLKRTKILGWAVWAIMLVQFDCHASIFDELIRDPLMDFVSKQAQEEGKDVHVLSIDINSDGLKDVLMSPDHVPGFDRFDANYWNIYLKIPGGYRVDQWGIQINDDFIALEDLGTSGTRVVSFFEDDRPERDSAREGDGHITWYDPQTFIWHRGISINPEDENFKSIFADNYARKIRKIPQTEITKFYEIDVFPAGRKKDYDNDLIKDEDLKTLPRTDPNSDTTGTLLTYGIILGNHTTSETLQLQAQAGGTSQTLRAKGGKGGATGKDRKQPDPKATPTPKASEKGKPSSANGTKSPSSNGPNAPVLPPADAPQPPSSRQKGASDSPQKDKKPQTPHPSPDFAPQSPPSAPRPPEKAPGQS